MQISIDFFFRRLHSLASVCSHRVSVILDQNALASLELLEKKGYRLEQFYANFYVLPMRSPLDFFLSS